MVKTKKKEVQKQKTRDFDSIIIGINIYMSILDNSKTEKLLE